MRVRKRNPGKLAVIFALVASAVPISIATFEANLPDSTKLDAAVVLGAAIYRDRPSPVFAARLDYARDLLSAGRVDWLILTGGFGEGESHSEAAVGKAYLVSRGVDPERVLIETSSQTTLENLCYAAAIGTQHGLRSYAVVSDSIHLRRALLYATDLDLHAVPAATPYTRYRGTWSRLKFLARESYYYSRRLLLGAQRCSP